MSTSYEGKASNVSLLAARTIASSTDATPIEITTAAPHGYLDGESVGVRQHATNVNANGLWKILVTSPTKFTLTSSVATGAGAGGATGFSVALAPRPATLVPDDADPPTASTFDPAFETQADQIASLSLRQGNCGVTQLQSVIIADDAAWSTVLWSSDATGAADTWTENQKNGAGAGGHGFTELAANVISDVGRDANDFDWLDFDFSTIVVVVANPTDFSLFLLIADYGVAPTFAAATRITGSRVRHPTGYFGPLRLRGRKKIALSRGKYARVYLGAKSAGGADAYTLQGDAQILVTQFRMGGVLP